MHLSEIERDYVITYQHNPSHFYPNSFKVEQIERRLVLVAVVKKHIGKNFKVVGFLKEKTR